MSEEQSKSFKFQSKKQVRDFKRFTMNSIYNFYNENVLQRYILKIGEFDEKLQQKPEITNFALIMFLLGCGLYGSVRFMRRSMDGEMN